MISTIHIKRLALYGHHGVMPQEKVVGAMFYVSLQIKCEVAEEAYLQDDLSGTISYADIIDHVRKEMSIPSALLEHLAYRVAKSLIDAFSRIQCVNIRQNIKPLLILSIWLLVNMLAPVVVKPETVSKTASI